ncbi:MetQ/NlpA family ABC transporter substrate-binding protein [Snodgrassella gandavensis]|uniref:MetQ/NlpA family ABC transporter substrate-binding protein n=1 Tax=Snodgrassella gandavensis TaxID=2946698 RepID=UPI001EF64690|nr:MetQ/NlpA family ABC transporter substrate-binding protein [Snodgrassella gandavensis]
MKIYLKTLFFSLCLLILAACGGEKTTQSAASSEQTKKEIIVGTTVGDFADMVRDQVKPELEKQGYKVQLLEFTDYVRPNLALADKSIDINIFQHKPYLDDFAQSRHLAIIPAFQVPTGPLGIYTGKLHELSAVKSGSSVSVPNDPSNLARALVMLDKLGWITLKANINPLKASLADIASNTKNIKLVPLEAAQLPRSRHDVDFAVINGNFATSSGLKFTSALFLEPGYTYVNWAAIRATDKDSQWVKDIKAAYNSAAFKQYAFKRFAGYKYPESWGMQGTQPTSAPAQ